MIRFCGGKQDPAMGQPSGAGVTTRRVGCELVQWILASPSEVVNGVGFAGTDLCSGAGCRNKACQRGAGLRIKIDAITRASKSGGRRGLVTAALPFTLGHGNGSHQQCTN